MLCNRARLQPRQKRSASSIWPSGLRAILQSLHRMSGCMRGSGSCMNANSPTMAAGNARINAAENKSCRSNPSFALPLRDRPGPKRGRQYPMEKSSCHPQRSRRHDGVLLRPRLLVVVELSADRRLRASIFGPLLSSGRRRHPARESSHLPNPSSHEQ